jgi:hypothetical protein
MTSPAGLKLYRHARKLCLWLTIWAASCAASVQAASEAILNYTDSISAYVSRAVGWTFECSNAVSVTTLGCFAKVFDDNPLATTIQVGLWDHGGVLLVSHSVNANSPLFGQGRYEPVAPVSLAPGQVYHLGIYYSGGSIGVDIAGEAAGGLITTAPQVRVRGAASASAGFAFPAEVAGTSGSIYAGPNFTFQTRPILQIQTWPGHQVRLSWSTGFAGYTLQSELGLSGTWTSSGLTVTNAGSDYIAFDSIGAAPKYYRLLK